MERTLRGVLRFSPGGLTKSRMARRLWVSADLEISAHTGRPSIFSCFVGLGAMVVLKEK
jgi:hypothetical protein